MKNYIRVIGIALLALTLTNCASTNYQVNKEAKEEGRVLNQVPQWYVDAKITRELNFTSQKLVLKAIRKLFQKLKKQLLMLLKVQ